MPDLNSDEQKVIDAIQSNSFDEALNLWNAYQEEIGICDDAACESQPDKRICCASHMHGRLFSLAVMNSDPDLAGVSRKLGRWMHDQEITNNVSPVKGENPLSLPNSLLTGHPTVDYEHRQLINILNHFSESIEQGDYETAETQIRLFFDLVVKHFENEEQILLDVGFPEAERHKEFHDQLRDRAAKYISATHDLQKDDKQKCTLQSEMISLLFDDAIKADVEFKSFLMVKGYAAT